MVTETCRSAGGEYTQEFEFDRAGRCVDTLQRLIRVEHLADGVRTETAKVAAVDYWSIRGLNGHAFPTRGAAVAETSYSRLGTPVRTIFRGPDNELVSRVEYFCDHEGRVVEARQYNGDVAVTGAASAIRILAEPGIEQVRVTFVYDHVGCLIEQTSDIAGYLHSRVVQTFNEHGDPLTFQADADEPFEFEYEYDNQGNWTRKITHHSSGAIEYDRVITYYETADGT